MSPTKHTPCPAPILSESERRDALRLLARHDALDLAPALGLDLPQVERAHGDRSTLDRPRHIRYRPSVGGVRLA